MKTKVHSIATVFAVIAVFAAIVMAVAGLTQFLTGAFGEGAAAFGATVLALAAAVPFLRWVLSLAG